MESVTQQLVQLLNEKGRDFVPLSEIKKSKSLMRLLGLSGKAGASDILEALRPHLAGSLQLLKGRSAYLALAGAKEDFVKRAIEKKPGQTMGKYSLPFSKDTALNCFNNLLKSGLVRVTSLTGEGKPRFELKDGDVEPPVTQTDAPRTEEALKGAFDELAQGKNRTLVYKLRQALAWPRSDFDALLKDLRNRGAYQLYGGNTENLTPSELQDCFTDENGYLMVLIVRG